MISRLQISNKAEFNLPTKAHNLKPTKQTVKSTEIAHNLRPMSPKSSKSTTCPTKQRINGRQQGATSFLHIFVFGIAVSDT